MDGFKMNEEENEKEALWTWRDWVKFFLRP